MTGADMTGADMDPYGRGRWATTKSRWSLAAALGPPPPYRPCQPIAE